MKAPGRSLRFQLAGSHRLIIDSATPFIDFALSLLAIVTVTFLHTADQFVFLAAEHGPVTISKLCPLLLSVAFKLFPISFNLIPVHLCTSARLEAFSVNSVTNRTRSPVLTRIGPPHLLCNFHRLPDLDKRSAVNTRTALRSFLPTITILNQFRPEWVKPALYGLHRVYLTATFLKEMTLRSLWLA